MKVFFLRIVIILGLETVSAPLPASIGNPNNIEQTSATPSTTSTTPFSAPPQSTNTSLPPPPSAAAPSYSKPPPAKRTLPPQYGNSTNAHQQLDAASWPSSVHPIKSLNPYSPRFTIKARVTSKSEMREWSNAKGNGRLFHVDLVDTTVSNYFSLSLYLSTYIHVNIFVFTSCKL